MFALTAVPKPAPTAAAYFLPRSKTAHAAVLSRVPLIWQTTLHLSPWSSAMSPGGQQIEELLRQVPQVDLERMSDKSDKDIADKAAKIRDDIKTDPTAFIRRLTKERSDLAGLPFLIASGCTLSKKEAGTLASYSLDIRSKLGRNPAVFFSAAAETWGTWLGPEGLAALQQIVLGEDRGFRLELVRALDAVTHPRATSVLVNRAVFDPDDQVRAEALRILKYRPKDSYRRELLAALRYPWEPAAVHAAVAIAGLQVTDLVPDLIAMIDAPDPDRPFQVTEKNGSKKHFVRELVRINHHRNCLVCHAPAGQSMTRAELRSLPIGPVPSPEGKLPTRSAVYYAARNGATLVRADVTYLRQDFSLQQIVDKPGKWPKLQRFDFLVRTRELTEAEVRKLPPPPPISGYKEAVRFTLQALNGGGAFVAATEPGPEVSCTKNGGKGRSGSVLWRVTGSDSYSGTARAGSEAQEREQN